MKKKVLLASIVFVMTLSSVFGWQNTYKASDRAYRDLMDLKNICGVNFPVMTTPVTSDQMNNMLSLIDPSKLNGYALEVYNGLKEEFSHPHVLFAHDGVGGDINLWLNPAQLFADTEKCSSYEEDWVLPVKDRFNLYDVKAQIFITPYFYGTLTANGTKRFDKMHNLNDSIQFNSIFDPSDMSKTWPIEAYGSLGGKYMNLMVGRSRLSAGNGNTGNMYLSENRSYDDFGKFSIAKVPLAYDFTAIVCDGYYKKDGKWILRTTDFDGPCKMVITHRFSGTICKKVTLSAFEGAVLYTSNRTSDLRALNPFMFLHNSGTYLTGNTNNFAGLEADIALPFGLSVNGQLIIDQFKLSSESDESGKTQFGILTNLKGAWSTEKGLLTAYTEAVYGSSGLYLKEFNNSENGYNDNGRSYNFDMVDMVSRNKRYEGESNEVQYFGYPEGGDLFKFACGVKYRMKKSLLYADASVLIKGSYGIRENEQPSLDIPIPYNVKQKVFSTKVGVDVSLLDGLDFSASIAAYTSTGHRHCKNAERNSVQAYIGCRLDPTLLIIKRNRI